MPSQFKAKRRRKSVAKPRSAGQLCEQCGKPARGPGVGELRFCKSRCRAAYLSARSRRAAAQGKKLSCPACGRANEPKAKTCESCKQRILWRERSPLWTAVVWSMRLSLVLSVAGSAYLAWHLKNLLGPDGAGSLVSVLGGGGNQDLTRLLQQGGSTAELEALLERSGREAGGKPEDLDALLERVERGEAGTRPAPKLPGPGTWLVGQQGVPAMLFSQNPMDPAFWPEGFGQMPLLDRAKAMGGMVTSGKVSMLLGATKVRVVEESGMFSRVEVMAGPKEGTIGWAQSGQIFESGAYR